MMNMRFRNPGQLFSQLLLDAWPSRAWLECIAIHWCMFEGHVTTSLRQTYLRQDPWLHDNATVLSTLLCLQFHQATVEVMRKVSGVT
jgi:hypothetical protein